MLITNIVTTVVTACAVLAPAAIAADEVKAKKSGKTDCSSSVGPTRNYSRGVCYALYSTDWGMKIVEYDTRCKVVGYPDGNCGGAMTGEFSTRECHSLKGMWSIKVQCSS